MTEQQRSIVRRLISFGQLLLHYCPDEPRTDYVREAWRRAVEDWEANAVDDVRERIEEGRHGDE